MFEIFQVKYLGLILANLGVIDHRPKFPHIIQR